MTDYRERYKPLFRCDTDDYAVIEEHSKEVVDPGPLTYVQAQVKADQRNAHKAAQYLAALD